MHLGIFRLRPPVRAYDVAGIVDFPVAPLDFFPGISVDPTTPKEAGLNIPKKFDPIPKEPFKVDPNEFNLPGLVGPRARDQSAILDGLRDTMFRIPITKGEIFEGAVPNVMKKPVPHKPMTWTPPAPAPRTRGG